MADRQRTERIRIPLPDGFDPARHKTSLEQLIATEFGDGFEIDHIDPSAGAHGEAIAVRSVTLTEVMDQESTGRREVRLAKGTKPADGDRVAARFADQYPGEQMIEFQPFLGYAVVAPLDPATSRCRNAVAGALGAKPWDIKIDKRSDGGFDLQLPETYMPSRHDSKLQEIAEAVVGSLGWTIDTDPATARVAIVPGEPPSFPPVIRYPFSQPFVRYDAGPAWARIPLGMQLGSGPDPTDEFHLDLEAAPHSMVSGTSGGGKMQPLDSRIPVPVSDRFPDGWATIETLGIGDLVFTADGTTAPITGFSDIVTDTVYEFTLSDGQKVRCGGNHLWKVSSAASRAAANHSRRRGFGPCRDDVRPAQAELLRRRATEFDPGTHARVNELALIAGIDASHARRVAVAAGVPFTVLNEPTSTPGGVVTSTHLVAHYDRDLARTALRFPPGGGESLLQPLRVIVTDATGEATKDSLNRARKRLQRCGVQEERRPIPVHRSVGAGNRDVHVYPVGEFLLALADALESNQRGGRHGAVMPLESVVDTATMAESVLSEGVRAGAKNWAVRVAVPFDPADATLPVDPYVLGAWLGDGSTRCSQITQGAGERCTDGDGLADRGHLIAQIAAAGYQAHVLPSSDKTVSTKGLTADLRAAGVLRKKHIPAVYLRSSAAQRLALLQGLMDTDGHIAPDGGCELTLCDKRLAYDALELIRSLGIKCAINESDALITEDDPDRPGRKRRRVTGTRWRMVFTTTTQVFRLPRKAVRIKPTTRPTQEWLYVASIEMLPPVPMRCLRVAHPGHLYLTEGFVPTHNSVIINSLIAGVLARGSELVVVDLPAKAVDFIWCKQFVRPGGWGCDNLKDSVTSLALVYEEGQRRAALLAQHGVTKWTDLPSAFGLRPIVVIIDEVTGLFMPEEVPKGLPKDHELVTGPQEVNMLKATLRSYIAKLSAELRFVGVKVLVSSQVSSTATGVPTAIRLNLGNKLLLGTKPTDNNRRVSLSDPTSVPKVPGNIQTDAAAGRGVGVAEPEGQEPCVFKGYFASTDKFAQWLESLGTPTTDRPSPTPAEVALHTPTLADSGPAAPTGRDGGWGEVHVADGGGAASVSAAFAPTEMCTTCGGPIDPLTGACHCTR